jgi:hypothetical protein
MKHPGLVTFNYVQNTLRWLRSTFFDTKISVCYIDLPPARNRLIWLHSTVSGKKHAQLITLIFLRHETSSVDYIVPPPVRNTRLVTMIFLRRETCSAGYIQLPPVRNTLGWLHSSVIGLKQNQLSVTA